MNKVTPEQIKDLLAKCTVATSVNELPVPHVITTVWLEDIFHLATSISKTVDPAEFDVQLGIKYSTADALKQAEEKLWSMEGYVLYNKLRSEV